MTLLAAKQKPLVLRDEIHGDMSFDPLIRCIVDNESYQRLRYIKQLGLAEYVFPCATHTRFQHSLGAAYLAGEYFDRMMESWLSSPFLFEGTLGKTEFYGERTWKCIRAVADHGPSQQFWRRVVTLGGLLHDVGHGPWSHSFETLNLKQDFSAVTDRMEGAAKEYFDGLDRLMHEDISVVYIFRILKEMEERKQIADHREYFPAVASLVNKGMSASMEGEVEEVLRRRGYEGGVDMHRLLRPMISGPFDVDRMDYIQRDGRNSGVHIGGIEWPRIVAKVLPCLAKHEAEGEPSEVVLVSNVKNQHVLDDFIFSLFQMYAQVYMHPKIVGIEESIRAIFENGVPKRSDFVVTFDVHRSLTDERFRAMLSAEFGITEVDEILFRRPGSGFKIVSYPEDAKIAVDLGKSGFTKVVIQDRPMLKDSVGVFLFSTFSESPKELFLRHWLDVSPIARKFHSIRHAPQFWLRRERSGQ